MTIVPNSGFVAGKSVGSGRMGRNRETGADGIAEEEGGPKKSAILITWR